MLFYKQLFWVKNLEGNCRFSYYSAKSFGVGIGNLEYGNLGLLLLFLKAEFYFIFEQGDKMPSAIIY